MVAEDRRGVSSDELTIHDNNDNDRYLAKEKEEAVQETSPSAKETAAAALSDDDFPDGGLQAWLVVLGSVCVNISTFGLVNGWGTFQSYYTQTLLPNTNASAIAWIGSIQYSLVFLPGLVSGRLFDIGYFRLPFTIASIVLLVACFLTAECTQYWQFLLCQGFAIGLASGVMFGPTQGILAHWFRKKRQTALGICAIGSSIGGTLFPIIFRNLVGKIGFKWTIRVIGFILMVTVSVGNVTLRRRLPPIHVSGGLFNWKAFKKPAFSIYVFTCFIAFLGLYTVLTYIDISASDAGVDESFTLYLVSIANASSAFGRIMAGFLADRIGGINVMMPFTFAAGILTYLWPLAHTKSGFIAIAVLYGFSSGVYVSLLIAPVLALGETGDVGRRVGMTMTIQAFGALAGPPISGAINVATGGYLATGIYAGTVIMLSVVLMGIVRYLVLGKLWGKF
ncbi:MFS general substrate transporter [Gloeophyllum trabeum ATCC 11539]|uniref:MFS general substrate transporter n=1 Tax=Gloeophyllum trabeum (strain ATCC 11539 / FP-39264 / Madison 617) TaxID=670483 RepID=S7QDA2_GLOTA|nr:MFS general substrate transporter [Gloeophyllum trabeum ATCC 11539]EPQ57826.1 MFS general substrate transporter [Gloeophyllum trabeum ATCC 11539]